MIPRRQSSHLQIEVERSEILSAFCDKCENNEELESMEFVRGKLVKKEPPLNSPESIPRLTNNINHYHPSINIMYKLMMIVFEMLIFHVSPE